MRPLLALAIVAGCGGAGGVGSHDEAADAVKRALEDAGAALSSVRDKASAEAAKPKLEAAAKRLREIAAAVEKMEPLHDVSKTEPRIVAGLEALNIEMIVEWPREVHEVLDGAVAAVSAPLMRLRGALGG